MNNFEKAKSKLESLSTIDRTKLTYDFVQGLDRLTEVIENGSSEYDFSAIEALWIFRAGTDDGGVILMLKTPTKSQTVDRIYLNGGICDFLRQDIIFDYDKDFISEQNEFIINEILDDEVYLLYKS